MFLRSAAIACAAAMFAALALPASADAPARCAATTFRVYFAHDAATLSPAAMDVIEAAARRVADCSYAELRVAVDGPLAARRAAVIRAAAETRGWDAVRIAPRRLTRAAHAGSPDFAEVEMTPHAAPTLNTSTPSETDTGV